MPHHDRLCQIAKLSQHPHVVTSSGVYWLKLSPSVRAFLDLMSLQHGPRYLCSTGAHGYAALSSRIARLRRGDGTHDKETILLAKWEEIRQEDNAACNARGIRYLSLKQQVVGTNGMMRNPALWNHVAFATRTRVRQARSCLNSLVQGA